MVSSTPKQRGDLDSALRAVLSELRTVVSIPMSFLEAVEKNGAHRALCEFLQPGGGFPRELLQLHRKGMLPISIEAMVLKPEWKDYFDEHMLLEASQRIQELSASLN